MKWQLCIHSRPALVYLYSVMHCRVYRSTILKGWGMNRVLFRTSFLVYCSWPCHAAFSIRMETPSSWVSICQFINLRSESVSVQVIVCKAWGLVLCPQWLPPQFLFQPPPPCPIVGDKKMSLSLPSQTYLTPSRTNQKPHGGWDLLQKNGGNGMETESQHKRWQTWHWNFGDCGKVISPVCLPQWPPLEIAYPSHLMWRHWGLSESLWESAFTYRQDHPNISLKKRLVSKGHTLRAHGNRLDRVWNIFRKLNEEMKERHTRNALLVHFHFLITLWGTRLISQMS